MITTTTRSIGAPVATPGNPPAAPSPVPTPADNLFNGHYWDIIATPGVAEFGYSSDVPDEVHVGVTDPTLMHLDREILRDRVQGCRLLLSHWNTQQARPASTTDSGVIAHPGMPGTAFADATLGASTTATYPSTAWYKDPNNFSRAIAGMPGVVEWRSYGQYKTILFRVDSVATGDRLRNFVRSRIEGNRIGFVMEFPDAASAAPAAASA